MSLLEEVNKYTEKVTGFRRPDKQTLGELVRGRKPIARRFKDDGLIPNNPRWPLVLYRNVVALSDDHDPAVVFEDLFAKNGWVDSLRNGIYDYVHYHSRIH